MKGVDDLDFFIGDEAIDKPTYATKVISCNSTLLHNIRCDRCAALETDALHAVKEMVEQMFSTLSLHAVAHQAWYRRGLGSNGEVHGAGHL